MKKFLIAAMLAFAFLAPQANAAVEIGKAAPNHTFKDIAGKEHSIAGFKGKTVVLEWTNPGCPFVRKFYGAGEMQRVQSVALKDKNVVWISINSSAEGKEGNLTNDTAKKWIAEQKSNTSAYVLDASGEFGNLYGAKTTPHLFVIDKAGIVQYQGAIDSIKSADSDDIKKADNYVLKALAALKDGSKVEPSSTQPYGCSVKYAD